MQLAILLTLGLCITLYFTYSLVTVFRKTKPPKGWPVTPGKMMLLKGNEALLPSNLHRMEELMITYLYEVNGTRYQGTWYGPIPRLKDKLLKGEHIEVYYKPDEPSVTFLEGKVPPAVIGLNIGMTTLGLTIAAAALLY